MFIFTSLSVTFNLKQWEVLDFWESLHGRNHVCPNETAFAAWCTCSFLSFTLTHEAVTVFSSQLLSPVLCYTCTRPRAAAVHPSAGKGLGSGHGGWRPNNTSSRLLHRSCLPSDREGRSEGISTQRCISGPAVESRACLQATSFIGRGAQFSAVSPNLLGGITTSSFPFL